ncbi:50S ribosomal protein L25/general stress protein Ctc [Xenophilus arseniciresistens]|uniref:Large ribosomal subunit protein bL25 n=1 Tax=Xenophilus arseniciresistens TaxID=1283306 RepID=A0AAE3SY16_9BURK|nr:50S ribosomal protein L25/general stress protein Ctc [Xenophilus arseniciresistens]MDA7415549.1 50S ribosomal protein L25/general stress protein Ctc [Xenophilus arseniciresistens]
MKFVAFERAKQGTGASRRLRNAGKTPGIVYGGEGQQPQLVELDHNALWHALKKEAFHASILEMDLGGTVSKVLLRDVQYHPFKQLVQHVDFQRVDARTRLTVKVPLHFKGEEESEAVKLHHNLVNHVMTEIQISVLPADLPEFIEVDLSGLTNAATVHVSDLKLPKGAKVILHGKPNPVVATAVAPVVEEEAPAAAAPAPAAAPAKGGKKK